MAPLGGASRFRRRCATPVHDLSALAPCDAAALLARPGPPPCVRFAVEPPGARLSDLARAVALAGVAAVAGCGVPGDHSVATVDPPTCPDPGPRRAVAEDPAPAPAHRQVMGKMRRHQQPESAGESRRQGQPDGAGVSPRR
jgi:hypothetical protein